MARYEVDTLAYEPTIPSEERVRRIIVLHLRENHFLTHNTYYHPYVEVMRSWRKGVDCWMILFVKWYLLPPRLMMTVVLWCVVHSTIRFCYYPYDAIQIQLTAPQMVHSAFVGWLLHTMYLINLIMWRCIRAVRENREAATAIDQDGGWKHQVAW